MAVGNTAIWRVRPSGVNTNGGGYDPGIGGAGTDYSQQNAAQASGSNATCTTGTSTFVDATANAFTSAMVGNAIHISSGTNFTAGWYFVTAFTSASTVTLDRSPVGGSNGSAGVWSLGGGWADPFANTTSSGPLVAGNVVYILGSGTPNPSSYTLDYTYNNASNFTAATGDGTNGPIVFANDPSTPGYKAYPDTTGGMPTLKMSTSLAGNVSFTGDILLGLWFVSGAGITSGSIITATFYNGCVVDILGTSATNGLNVSNSGGGAAYGCEVFSSTTKAGNGLETNGSGCIVSFCNIHDAAAGNALYLTNAHNYVTNCIVAKNGGDGVYLLSSRPGLVQNCTIDGNGIHGIETDSQGTGWSIINNIISNHTGGGAFGIKFGAGTAAQNSRVNLGIIDYNVFYNNTANYSAFNAAPHDTALGVTPYVGSATENYALA